MLVNNEFLKDANSKEKDLAELAQDVKYESFTPG